MKPGQIDAAASGQMACERLAPTLRVSRCRAFSRVATRRRRCSAACARSSTRRRTTGFTILGISGLGPSVFFTRNAGAYLAELRKVKLWRWAADEVGTASSREMGLAVQPLPLYEAAKRL